MQDSVTGAWIPPATFYPTLGAAWDAAKVFLRDAHLAKRTATIVPILSVSSKAQLGWRCIETGHEWRIDLDPYGDRR